MARAAFTPSTSATACLIIGCARTSAWWSWSALNARDLPALPEVCDLAVFDLSFIGLEKVIPAACRSLKPGGDLIVLLKPQFQAKREEVGKKGVVKDPMVHAAVVGRFVAWAAGNGLRLLGLTLSPIIGPAGNREFLLAPETGRLDTRVSEKGTLKMGDSPIPALKGAVGSGSALAGSGSNCRSG